jgi:hypothetical protein
MKGESLLQTYDEYRNAGFPAGERNLSGARECASVMKEGTNGWPVWRIVKVILDRDKNNQLKIRLISVHKLRG